MGFLFYAYYMNTDSQSICGVGAGRVDSGQTDYLGMTDTYSETNGNSHSVNFWGLEGWWGGYSENIDDIECESSSSHPIYLINEDDTKELIGNLRGTNLSYIKKINIGENLSMIPSSSGGSESTYFCDMMMKITSSSPSMYNTSRGAHDSQGSASGISYFHSFSSGIVSRLCYRGDYIIE